MRLPDSSAPKKFSGVSGTQIRPYWGEKKNPSAHYWLHFAMSPNLDKIDDAVLALLHLTSFTEGKGPFAVTRAWKSHDWDVLDRLYQKGLISDAKNKNKSVVFTEEGRAKAEVLYRELFCD
jgi:Domain of unknown function (DUF6429)